MLTIRETLAILDPVYEVTRELDGNAAYQELLAEQIQRTGKPVDQLTLAELRTCTVKASHQYQKLIARGVI